MLKENEIGRGYSTQKRDDRNAYGVFMTSSEAKRSEGIIEK
jgi:hypothetical protein